MLQAQLRHLQLEAETGGYEATAAAGDRIEAIYDSIARLVNAGRAEIALVENATVAWDMAFYSVGFAKGDRILTVEAEYASNACRPSSSPTSACARPPGMMPRRRRGSTWASSWRATSITTSCWGHTSAPSRATTPTLRRSRWRVSGMEGIVSAFMEAAVWGTPDRILRRLEERRALVGDFELATSFRFGGTPFDLAECGLRLYAKEVMPVVRAWTKAGS